MKGIASIFVFIFLFSHWSIAQQEETQATKRKMFVGLVVGGNSSWLRSDETGSNTPGLGFKSGLSAAYELSPHFFLQSSLDYLSEKNITTSSYPNGAITTETKYSWVELPVTINYVFFHKKGTSIFLGSGVSIRRSIAYNQTNITPNPAYDVFYFGEINSWNTFPIVQLGTTIETSGHHRISLMVSYQSNAFKLFPPKLSGPAVVGYTIYSPDYKLNSVSLTLYYSFNLRSLNTK